jgi:adenine/guanine phosphoribosyltransferase-like PRPP-binding protein
MSTAVAQKLLPERAASLEEQRKKEFWTGIDLASIEPRLFSESCLFDAATYGRVGSGQSAFYRQVAETTYRQATLPPPADDVRVLDVGESKIKAARPMPVPHYTHTGYLTPCCDEPRLLRTAIKTARKELRDIKFDMIVCRGVSGMLFASPLAYSLNKPLVVIRKLSGVKQHSDRYYEGFVGASSYIIVDDLIDSGKTVLLIRKTVAYRHEFSGFAAPHLVGAYLYGARCFRHPSGDPDLRREIDTTNFNPDEEL